MNMTNEGVIRTYLSYLHYYLETNFYLNRMAYTYFSVMGQ